MNEIHAKFTLKYSYVGSDSYSPVDVTFEIPGDATVDQMLFNFQSFLQACGFYIEGEFVQSLPEEKYEGCMADWDKEDDNPSFHDTLSTAICEDAKKKKFSSGLEDTSSPLEKDEWDENTFHEGLNEMARKSDEKIKKSLKEWNEGIAKLENDLKAKRDIEQQAYERASRNAAVVKNNWVHGMCNPSSPDWKVKNLEGDLSNIMDKL